MKPQITGKTTTLMAVLAELQRSCGMKPQITSAGEAGRVDDRAGFKGAAA
ncbi:hypothetical protein WQQ_15310 [Hydrocarboniphaga effusa AP103]|uniref:Uncharacterized protein n=1 Tax=Hydrocarboniphaga effusa AP103 TaxID=1172194 RepID=I7ZHL6_9GAMM|nr:hypothetical protein WQQ_15310 [Hydrocarboniphaga effusa AP103]